MTAFTPIDRLVAANLRLLRPRRGLTQAELARYLGVSLAQAQKYDAGIDRITAGRLHAIAQFLSVPVETLFEPTRRLKELLRGRQAASLRRWAEKFFR